MRKAVVMGLVDCAGSAAVVSTCVGVNTSAVW